MIVLEIEEIWKLFPSNNIIDFRIIIYLKSDQKGANNNDSLENSYKQSSSRSSSLEFERITSVKTILVASVQGVSVSSNRSSVASVFFEEGFSDGSSRKSVSASVVQRDHTLSINLLNDRITCELF